MKQGCGWLLSGILLFLWNNVSANEILIPGSGLDIKGAIAASNTDGSTTIRVTTGPYSESGPLILDIQKNSSN